MRQFRRNAIATRYRSSPAEHGPERRSPTPDVGTGAVDPKAGEILRGLMFGVPVGLAIWLLLGFLVVELF